MQVCGNCGAQITCNCQLRTASDGKTCCGNCIESYEQTAAQAKKFAQDAYIRSLNGNV